MQDRPDPLSVIHKLLRVAVAGLVERLGRTPALNDALLRETQALVAVLAWRNAFVDKAWLPLLEQQEPGAAAPALAELHRLDAMLNGMRDALSALPLQPAAEGGSAWARLYQRCAALQCSALAQWHRDDTTWLPRVWRGLPAERQRALWQQVRGGAAPALLSLAAVALTPAELEQLETEGERNA